MRKVLWLKFCKKHSTNYQLPVCNYFWVFSALEWTWSTPWWCDCQVYESKQLIYTLQVDPPNKVSNGFYKIQMDNCPHETTYHWSSPWGSLSTHPASNLNHTLSIVHVSMFDGLYLYSIAQPLFFPPSYLDIKNSFYND